MWLGCHCTAQIHNQSQYFSLNQTSFLWSDRITPFSFKKFLQNTSRGKSLAFNGSVEQSHTFIRAVNFTGRAFTRLYRCLPDNVMKTSDIGYIHTRQAIRDIMRWFFFSNVYRSRLRNRWFLRYTCGNTIEIRSPWSFKLRFSNLKWQNKLLWISDKTMTRDNFFQITMNRFGE